MKIDTYIRVSTTVVLEPAEQFDFTSEQMHGTLRVQRLRVGTSLTGSVDTHGAISLDGLRHKQDGTVGKAPATGVYVYQDEMAQIPEALLDAIKDSVQDAVVAEGGVAVRT